MRQQSKKKIEVRGQVIGGERVLVCLPMTGASREKLLAEATELASLGPDLIEWRIDAFTDAADAASRNELLAKIREIIEEIPLIFTCRCENEGGLQTFTEQTRVAIITDAISSRNIDLIDIELCNDLGFKQSILEAAHSAGVKIILSHHNFSETPDVDFINNKLIEAQKQGADIAKVAVMPKSSRDVLTLLSATDKARNTEVQIPIIAISMAQTGIMSRVAGGLFGSDITFAAGIEASAPGQLAFKDLKLVMEIVTVSE